MSMVPHTRTHALDPRIYTRYKEPVTLEHSTDITSPVQLKTKDNGYPSDPTKWTYVNDIYDLNSLIRCNNMDGKDPITRQRIIWNNYDPVHWGDHSGGNWSAQAIETERILNELRVQQAPNVAAIEAAEMAEIEQWNIDRQRATWDERQRQSADMLHRTSREIALRRLSQEQRTHAMSREGEGGAAQETWAGPEIYPEARRTFAISRAQVEAEGRASRLAHERFQIQQSRNTL